MNRRMNIGLIVIVVGLLAFVVPRIPFDQTREPLEPGPVGVEEGDRQGAMWFDVVAGVVTAGGIVLVVTGLSRKDR